VHGLSAAIADQEDAIVQAVGMGIRHIGIRAFDTAREVGADEQVEDPIDAIGRDAPVLVLRNGLGNIVSAGRPIEGCERFEDCGSHVGPLLAAALQVLASGIAERVALMQVVLMSAHEDGDKPRSGTPQGARADGYSAAMRLS